jgi:hypothetical protein
VLSAGVEVWRWRVLAGRSMVRRGCRPVLAATGPGCGAHRGWSLRFVVRTHLRTATRTFWRLATNFLGQYWTPLRAPTQKLFYRTQTLYGTQTQLAVSCGGVDSVAGGVAGHCLRDSADALAPSHTPPSVPCTSPSRRGQLRKFVYLYRRVTSESKETRDLTLT